MCGIVALERPKRPSDGLERTLGGTPRPAIPDVVWECKWVVSRQALRLPQSRGEALFGHPGPAFARIARLGLSARLPGRRGRSVHRGRRGVRRRGNRRGAKPGGGRPVAQGASPGSEPSGQDRGADLGEGAREDRPNAEARPAGPARRPEARRPPTRSCGSATLQECSAVREAAAEAPPARQPTACSSVGSPGRVATGARRGAPGRGAAGSTRQCHRRVTCLLRLRRATRYPRGHERRGIESGGRAVAARQPCNAPDAQA